MPPTPSRSQRVNIHALLEEVKKRNLLWDPRDDEYMDREATAAAWQDIANNLSSAGIEVKGDIKLKWKCLRDTYRRITKTDKEKRSRWPYYKRLNFLQEVPIKKRLTGFTEEQNGDAEHHNPEFLEDTNGDTNEEHGEYIKCEGSSDNEESANPLETETNTLELSEDYDMMFLKSLVPYLKSLAPLRQLIVRNKIQDILLNELAAQKTQRSSK